MRLIAVLMLFVYTSGHAQTIIPSGEVSGTWIKSKSPYIIEGDIEVTTNLIIEPGVKIRFNNNSQLSINGSFKAIGSKTDSIYFEAHEDQWGGIRISNNQNPIEFKYFSVSGVFKTEGYGGAVFVENSQNTRINKGVFFNNTSVNYGGGLTLINQKNFDVKRLLFYNNNLIDDENFRQNRDGYAMYILRSRGRISNVTAVKNGDYLNMDEYGSVFHVDGEVAFVNCLIQNNRSLPIWCPNNDQINLSYSNVDFLSEMIRIYPEIWGQGYYDETPVYESFESNDFRIKWSNTSDINQKPREIDGGDPSIHDPDGSVSDIGAFYVDQQGVYFPPKPMFEVKSRLFEYTSEVKFLNKSQKGSLEIASYKWDFGDGNFSEQKEPVYTYDHPGVYNVSLTMIDIEGNEFLIDKKDYIYAGTEVESGFVSGAWNEESSPYIVKGDIHVRKNELLKITKGTRVVFDGYYQIIVEGDLQSIGDELKRNEFTSLDTLGFWSRHTQYDHITKKIESNGWKGITFLGQNEKSSLSYTDISRVRRINVGQGDTQHGSALIIVDTKEFVIDNCKFFDNHGNGYQIGSNKDFMGAAIKSTNSGLIIRNSHFENNHADHYTAVVLIETPTSLIENSVFQNNYSDLKRYTVALFSGEKLHESDTIIFRNNKVLNNLTGGIVAGGERVAFEATGILIEDNLIANNDGEGVWCDAIVHVNRNQILYNQGGYDGGGITIKGWGGKITNNLIKGNSMDYYWSDGSGIKAHHTNHDTFIANNTIIENRHIRGQAVYAENGSFTAINNIVFNNDGSIGQNDGAGVHPPLILKNNFLEDPLFVEGEAPLLQKGSPCIDAGTLELYRSFSKEDLFGNDRIFGYEGIVDIGAVEYSNEFPIWMKVTDVTCRGKENGKIEIRNHKNGQSHMLKITASNYDYEGEMTNQFLLEGLGSNNYTVCLTNKDSFKEICYEVEVQEPSEMQVNTTFDKEGFTKLTIQGGIKPYDIFLNGQLQMNTQLNDVEIQTKRGDLIEVKSSAPCEPSIALLIEGNSIQASNLVYPIPSSGKLMVDLSKDIEWEQKVEIEVQSIVGTTMIRRKVQHMNNLMELSIEHLPSGIYTLTLRSKEIFHYKFIKI